MLSAWFILLFPGINAKKDEQKLYTLHVSQRTNNAMRAKIHGIFFLFVFCLVWAHLKSEVKCPGALSAFAECSRCSAPCNLIFHIRAVSSRLSHIISLCCLRSGAVVIQPWCHERITNSKQYRPGGSSLNRAIRQEAAAGKKKHTHTHQTTRENFKMMQESVGQQQPQRRVLAFFCIRQATGGGAFN